MLLDEIEEELKRRKTPRPNEKIFHGNKRGSKARTKYAVVKNISTLNYKSTQNAMYYIAKGSEDGLLIDKNGNKTTVKDKYAEWEKNFTTKEGSKESIHLMFSIDERINLTNLEALEKSVADTLRQNFYEYDYVYTIHTHQKKPHAHVILNKRNLYTNKKIHHKDKFECRDFYTKLRGDFSENLNYHNRSFNYSHNYKIDRDLKIELLKDELKKINDKDNLLNNLRKNAETENKNITTNINEASNILSQNIKDESYKFSPYFDNKNLEKLNELIKNNQFYKKKLDILEKQKGKNDEFIKNINLLANQIDTNSMIEIDKAIKYFNTPAQKRLLSLSAYKILVDIQNDFNNFKFVYDKDFKNIILDDKKQMDFLSTQTNAFTIYQKYKMTVQRKFENDTVLKNKDLDKTLKENIKFARELFVSRADKLAVLKNNVLKTLQNEDLTLDKKKILEKSILYYDKELDFIEKIGTNNQEMNINFIDTKRFIKELDDNVQKLSIKNSAYSIVKYYNESVSRIDILIKDDVTIKTDVKELERIKDKLLSLLENRKVLNSDYLTKLSLTLDNIQDKDKYSEVDSKIKWLEKEKAYIKEFFTNINTTIEVNASASPVLKVQLDNNVQKLSDKNSAYEIIEEIVKNSHDKTLKDILMSRELKVKRVVTGLTERFYKSKDENKRNELRALIKDFKTEKTYIENFNNKNIKNFNREKGRDRD
ncbi:MAG: hypothetical protein RBR23_03705 [Arcobacteraceae bacterium]|jgi:hypothetical protein|nr:hypothetical protein [Arcobacteraceae bacterium]